MLIFRAGKTINLPDTDINLIKDFYAIGKEKLHYVYTGNMPAGTAGKDTECAKCGAVVIKRDGYKVDSNGLDEQGNCKT